MKMREVTEIEMNLERNEIEMNLEREEDVNNKEEIFLKERDIVARMRQLYLSDKKTTDTFDLKGLHLLEEFESVIVTLEDKLKKNLPLTAQEREYLKIFEDVLTIGPINTYHKHKESQEDIQTGYTYLHKLRLFTPTQQDLKEYVFLDKEIDPESEEKNRCSMM